MTATTNKLAAGARLKYTPCANGRKVHRVYDGHGGIDAGFSRPNKLAHDNGSGSPGTTLAEYDYLGDGRIVAETFGEPGMKLTRLETSGSDPYAKLDRFGRVLDQQWTNSAGTTTLDRFRYGYDEK